MSEQVVVICSAGEQLPAMDLCSKLEEQGLTCWSPVREEDPIGAMWVLPSKLKSARALVIVTNDPAEHQESIDTAASSRIPVLTVVPDQQSSGWTGMMKELADALGLSSDWLTTRGGRGSAQPKTHIARDEEEHLEFIAENVSEAQVFVRFGLFDKAVGRLQTVFAKAPRNLEAHDELLKIRLEEEDWKKAAGVAADFLDCLRYRGDDESYSILRAHLASMGFSVDDGPPVAVGFADVAPVPTKFFEAGAKPPPPSRTPAKPAAASSATPDTPAPAPTPKAVEPIPFELPALRNFKASNPIFQSSGVESELSGIDFFIDHGMLDEARMRIDQLAHEYPDDEGVKARLARIQEMGLSRLKTAIALELDDPWDAASRAPGEGSADAYFRSAATSEAEPGTEPSPAQGPVGEGDSLICTAFVPEGVEGGDMFVVRVCVHLPEQGDSPMLQSPHNRRESNMLAKNVERGKSLSISLRLPGFEIDGDRFDIQWQGEPDSVEFSVVVPFGQESGSVTGTLSVTTEAGPAGDFSITIPVS